MQPPNRTHSRLQNQHDHLSRKATRHGQQITNSSIGDRPGKNCRYRETSKRIDEGFHANADFGGEGFFVYWKTRLVSRG